MKQGEPIEEPKHQRKISKQCLPELFPLVEVSDILPTVEIEDSTILDGEKVLQESNKLVGAHDVKFKFDEFATDQPFIVEKLDATILPVAQETIVSFLTLISHIDFCNSI